LKTGIETRQGLRLLLEYENSSQVLRPKAALFDQLALQAYFVYRAKIYQAHFRDIFAQKGKKRDCTTGSLIRVNKLYSGCSGASGANGATELNISCCIHIQEKADGELLLGPVDYFPGAIEYGIEQVQFTPSPFIPN